MSSFSPLGKPVLSTLGSMQSTVMDSHDKAPEDLTSVHEKLPLQYPQGHPLGPPVKDWVFDAEIEAIKARIRVPTEVVEVEADDLYCICRGKDDGREMIHCSSEENCFYGWFHTSCIGMRQLPNADGIRSLCML